MKNLSPISGALPALSETPLISVIVPAYNMEQFTVLTVQSLLSQTYSPLEIIVVDDGSSDGTVARLEAAFGDRIRLLKQNNAGACGARNKGFAVSRGELIAFLDCDDLWEPDKARRCVEYFRGNPEVAMVYSHAYWIDAAGKIIGPRHFKPRPSGRIFDSLVLEDHVVNSTPLIRRAALEQTGLWDEKIFTTADWDLWLRLADRFAVGFIPRVLSRTRIASYYNSRNIDKTRRETLYLLDQYRSRLPPERYDLALANMHFYLSRLHAANNDFTSARLEIKHACRLAPARAFFRRALWLYRLGKPANLVLSRLWQCYTLLSCRWHRWREGQP